MTAKLCSHFVWLLCCCVLPTYVISLSGLFTVGQALPDICLTDTRRCQALLIACMTDILYAPRTWEVKLQLSRFQPEVEHAFL